MPRPSPSPFPTNRPNFFVEPSTTIESLRNSSTRCEPLASRCSSTPSKDPLVEKEEYHPKCALSSRHSGQMAANNVSLGDWATVTNNSTNQMVYARVEDIGPEGGTGEISQAAASGVGIQQAVVQTKDGPSTVTLGSPSVTVDVYAGTASIQGDCSSQVVSSL